jgi:very-short-patch-repair endonuclease
VADVACRAAHLVVEVDGGQHTDAVDASRAGAIQSFGYRVIRFWNNDVLENTAGVIEAIRQELLLAFNRAQ